MKSPFFPRKRYVIANWKMNFTKEQSENYFAEFPKDILSNHVGFAPQSLLINSLLDLSKNYPFLVGTQNCSSEEQGAFTGELSAKTIASFHIHFVILGHSERRNIFLEKNEQLEKKIHQALKHNLKIVFCVGETLKEREENLTHNIIENQLKILLPQLTTQNSPNFILAYEPVWAIGTGLNATVEQINDVHQFIRSHIDKNNGVEVPILYGGSVNGQNINQLANIPLVDGFLVGGASLKVPEFSDIIKKTLD